MTWTTSSLRESMDNPLLSLWCGRSITKTPSGVEIVSLSAFGSNQQCPHQNQALWEDRGSPGSRSTRIIERTVSFWLGFRLRVQNQGKVYPSRFGRSYDYLPLEFHGRKLKCSETLRGQGARLWRQSSQFTSFESSYTKAHIWSEAMMD